MKEFTCLWCGKVGISSNYARRSYCSRRCYEKDKSRKALVSKTCWKCGKKVVRRKCCFRKTSKHFYCSTRCASSDESRRKGSYLKCSRCGKVRYFSKSAAAVHQTDLCMDCNRKTNRKTIEAMHKARHEKADKQPVPCAECGKVLMLSKRARGAYGWHVCGRACWNKHIRKGMNKFTCVECGKEYQRSPSVKTSNYCSRKCWGAAFGRKIKARWESDLAYREGRTGANNPLFGKERTPELREHLRKTTKAAWDSGKIYPGLLEKLMAKQRDLNDVDRAIIKAMVVMRNTKRRYFNETENEGRNGALVGLGEQGAGSGHDTEP